MTLLRDSLLRGPEYLGFVGAADGWRLAILVERDRMRHIPIVGWATVQTEPGDSAAGRPSGRAAIVAMVAGPDGQLVPAPPGS